MRPSVVEMEKRIAEAQAYVRSLVGKGRKLSAELIQERRKEARRERGGEEDSSDARE